LGTADLDLGVELADVRSRCLHAQAHGTVGEVDDRARLDGLRQLRPGDRHPPVIADDLAAALERQALARRQLDEAVAHRADPELWSRQILQQRDGAPHALGRRAHARGRLGMLVE